MEQPTRRIPSLDGLRAISILMVVFCHASETVNYPPWLFKGPETFIIGGLGVRIFFVISGYLITTLLLREEQRYGRISLAGFYRRRALRIMPVYYFYIMVVAVIFSWLGLNAIHASTYLSALTFSTRLWGFWGGLSWPLQHFWSLAIEEQFYLVWPAMLVFLGARKAGRIWVPALILIAPILRLLAEDKYIDDLIFPMQGDALAFGCLLALVFDQRAPAVQRLFQYHPHMGRLGAFVLIYLQRFVVIALSHLHYDTSAVERVFTVFWPTLQCIGITYLIGSLVIVERGFSYRALNWEPMQWIGRLSYSLYIWQQLFMLLKAFPLVPGGWWAARWLGSFPQNIVMAFVVATLSYYFLEKPFLALKGRAGNRQPRKDRAAVIPQPNILREPLEVSGRS